MKYMKSNLVCVNVVSLPAGKQNDIGYEMCEGVWETYKIKIFAPTFMNMSIWKWVVLSCMIKYLPCLIVNFHAPIHKNLLLARCTTFEHVEPTIIYMIKIFHLH